jgi:hypothetical protein
MFFAWCSRVTRAVLPLLAHHSNYICWQVVCTVGTAPDACCRMPRGTNCCDDHTRVAVWLQITWKILPPYHTQPCGLPTSPRCLPMLQFAPMRLPHCLCGGLTLATCLLCVGVSGRHVSPASIADVARRGVPLACLRFRLRFFERVFCSCTVAPWCPLGFSSRPCTRLVNSWC